jgi:hypothetical protein
MVINDVPKITPDIRQKLSEVFNDQYSILSYNDFFTFNDDKFSDTFLFKNPYSHEHYNVAKNTVGKDVMAVFTFNPRNRIRIYRILNIDEKPILTGIRVYANKIVPMHIDLNEYSTAREKLQYVVPLTQGGNIYFSDLRDGSKKIINAELAEVAFPPTLIPHGAVAGNIHYDLLEIQIEG